MSAGSILVGVAIALVVGAALARPLRRQRMDPDRVIEEWATQVASQARVTDGTASYCPQCGRRAGPDDRFCAGCGTPVKEARQ